MNDADVKDDSPGTLPSCGIQHIASVYFQVVNPKKGSLKVDFMGAEKVKKVVVEVYKGRKEGKIKNLKVKVCPSSRVPPSRKPSGEQSHSIMGNPDVEKNSVFLLHSNKIFLEIPG